MQRTGMRALVSMPLREGCGAGTMFPAAALLCRRNAAMLHSQSYSRRRWQGRLTVPCFCLIVFTTALGASAATRRVPQQFPTIQMAIVASGMSGDTVLVNPGIYLENIDFLGKDVVVRSESGPESTIIDGRQPSNPDRASVAILQGVGNGARLEGFTLRGGRGSRGMTIGTGSAGGGVCISDNRNMGPVVQNNWITDNHANNGGGVLIAGAVRLRGNRIANNAAEADGPLTGTGGGMRLWEFDTPISLERRSISENEIFGNVAVNGGGAWLGGGGGPHFYEFLNNIVACNQADVVGGLALEGHPSTNIAEGNTIFANHSAQGGVSGVRFLIQPNNHIIFSRNLVAYNFTGGADCLILQAGYGIPDFSCNDFEGNNPEFQTTECGTVIGVNDNLSVDPLFGMVSGCPPADDDFCLSPESPLLPEHSPSGCGLIGARGLCPQIGVPEMGGPHVHDLQLGARPNPFSGLTLITFTLPEESRGEIAIYAVSGRKVRVLNRSDLPAGSHEITWDALDDSGSRVAAGGYVAVVRAGSQEVTRTILLIP